MVAEALYRERNVAGVRKMMIQSTTSFQLNHIKIRSFFNSTTLKGTGSARTQYCKDGVGTKKGSGMTEAPFY
jgi:hypothetical protein